MGKEGNEGAATTALWNANSTRTRDSARQRAFRKAAYELELRDAGNEDLPERVPFEEKEAADMFLYAQTNQGAKFGLVRLANRDLDRLYKLPEELRLKLDGTCVPAQMSLVEFASWTTIGQRDGILKSILAAHTNPFAQCQAQEARDMHSLIRDAPPAVRVWLVKHLVRMWLRVVCNGKAEACKLCGEKTNSDPSDFTLSRGSQWPGCGHVFCCKCAWTHVAYQPPRTFDLVCPSCGIRQADDNIPSPFIVSPEQVCQKSLEKFLQLSDVSIKDKKPKFRGLPMSAWVRTLLSTSKGDRQAKFWNAVMHGNVLRTHVLIEAGVNVNMRNEYGQTAMFMACWLGYCDMAKLLLSAGAILDTPCNQGVKPLEAALANAFDDLVQELVDPGKEEEHMGLSNHRIPCLNITHGESPKVEVLIPWDREHPGAGALIIDNCFSDDFLDALCGLCDKLPNATETKKLDSCSDRSYVCDSLNWISDGLEQALTFVDHPQRCRRAFKLMRFLKYNRPGGYLAPHVDLSRQDLDGSRSTHTFILYLEDCEEGGETALLERFPELGSACQTWNTDMELVIVAVKPKRGRLLVFPHVCPHEGRETVCVPKRLLRGEFA